MRADQFGGFDRDHTARVYLAGPLFTTAEREFNCRLAAQLSRHGHKVWLPQANEPRDQNARAIFLKDVEGIDWADTVVANMDGGDPDSGTCWECGYAFARNKHLITYRTDMRGIDDFAGSPFNLMLSQSSVYIDTKLQTVHDIALAINHSIYYRLRAPASLADREVNPGEPNNVV